jgi:hypothetical protein
MEKPNDCRFHGRHTRVVDDNQINFTAMLLHMIETSQNHNDRRVRINSIRNHNLCHFCTIFSHIQPSDFIGDT